VRNISAYAGFVGTLMLDLIRAAAGETGAMLV